MAKWQERTELLTGRESLEKLKASAVIVAGLGGVGAYAAEMCARAGVGKMIIIDADVVSESNINRQLIALNSTVGRKKAELMELRLRDINREIEVISLDVFIEEENISDLLSPFKADYIIDAIDTLSPKIALIKYSIANKIPIVSSMGAGAKYDITKIKIKDISKSFNCPLAYMLRKRLRKEGISKGFKVVFSEELPVNDAIMSVQEKNKKSIAGTISYVPAAFGLACAQTAITDIIQDK
jgi:tRNA A37 threonylcarbamoyladenosine dehydratase